MWATSIGSTFSHIPVPGVRKSGIPDGTEIPAPVSATTEPGGADQLREPVRPRAAGGGRGHLPWKRGVRLPRNAPMPSRASSEAKTVAKPVLLGLDALVEVALVGDLA